MTMSAIGFALILTALQQPAYGDDLVVAAGDEYATNSQGEESQLGDIEGPALASSTAEAGAEADQGTVEDNAEFQRLFGDGGSQGLNKAETAEKHGAEQVHIWRRSFDIPPPGGESLKMNAERTIPYFEEEIVPDLEEGKNVLVSAHGNSLRSIVMHIESISPSEIVSLEIAQLGAGTVRCSLSAESEGAGRIDEQRSTVHAGITVRLQDGWTP